MNKQMPFLDIMKLPMSVGNAVVEGGQIGLTGGDPLMATAKSLENALKQPLQMLSMGGQPPKLTPVFEQFKILSPAEVLKPFGIGGEVVGTPSKISGGDAVQTTIY